MARQRGWYEWDDESLRPGNREGGGWSQNLFDENGGLNGSARFIPDDDASGDDSSFDNYDPSSTFIPSEERRLTDTEEMLARIVSEVVYNIIATGIKEMTPHVKEWWERSARPFISNQTSKIKIGRKGRRTKTTTPANITVESSRRSSSHSAADLQPMSKAEAQARIIAAIAARTFSDEQLQMVRNANILDIEEVEAAYEAIAQIPEPLLSTLVKHMVRNPAALQDAQLANLASLLDQNILREIRQSDQ